MDKFINLRGGKSTNIGEKYYQEFSTQFWLKPGKYCLALIYLNFIV
jgi:hypothetical protein